MLLSSMKRCSVIDFRVLENRSIELSGLLGFFVKTQMRGDFLHDIVPL